MGAIAMLLLAPKSGRETREMMAEKAQEGKRVVNKGIRRAQETIKERKERLLAEAEDLLDEAKNLTRCEKESIMAAIEAGMSAYRE